MRITNNMMTTNTIWNVNKNMERLSKAQERMSTQSKIQLPSDDPVVATRAIKYRHYVASVKQYQKNAEDVSSWQKVTDSALGDLGDIIKHVQEKVVQASSTTLNDSDKAAIKADITQMRDHIIQIMNTSYAGRYVFAGFNTDEPPYELQGTAVGDKVMFKGQYLSLGGPVSATLSDTAIENFTETNAGQMYQAGASQSIQYNISFDSRVTVNVEGQNVIGTAGANLFDSLDKLMIALNGETSYKTATIDTSTTPATATVQSKTLEVNDVLSDLEQDYDRLLNVRADLGARMNYVNLSKTRLSNDLNTYTELMSNNEDIDLAVATTDVSSAQYVYEASLSVGLKVLSKSLVDFLS